MSHYESYYESNSEELQKQADKKAKRKRELAINELLRTGITLKEAELLFDQVKIIEKYR